MEVLILRLSLCWNGRWANFREVLKSLLATDWNILLDSFGRTEMTKWVSCSPWESMLFSAFASTVPSGPPSLRNMWWWIEMVPCSVHLSLHFSFLSEGNSKGEDSVVDRREQSKAPDVILSAVDPPRWRPVMVTLECIGHQHERLVGFWGGGWETSRAWLRSLRVWWLSPLIG